ncbi:MAG: CapA family protein [Oscillospiraceae bacterium]|nr:CapA family protein [Oscillospiraceae bacterium]
MAKKKRRTPTPQPPSGIAVLVLFLGVLILLAGLVRLTTELITANPRPADPPAAVTEAPETEEAETAAPEEKQSFWDKLFGKETQPPETEDTTPTETQPTVVSTATVASMGDMLMHIQLFSKKHDAIANLGDGNYDFSPVFEYLTDTVRSYDYAIANLETTFGGDDYPYQGNPTFNCPDQLSSALADTGYDMMLTANNHCSDTLLPGIKRTLNVVRQAGMDTLGTRLTEDEQRYEIVEVNGIKIGMTCYTYTLKMVDGVPSLNGGLPLENPDLVNYFTYNDLNGFYSQVDAVYDDMTAAGAEATMMFIHWGDEYQLTENATQNAIAQKLCDLGFDVIVGGHPHVVQPMELLESTVNPDHKTVCLYSLGNSVSNQRLGNLTSITTAHTEDGVLLSVTFEKYSDGSVAVSAADILPLWVNMHSATGKLEYNILPLDAAKESSWAEDFGLTAETLKAAKDSHKRSMDIVGAGLAQCQSWLSQARNQRLNPDKEVNHVP